MDMNIILYGERNIVPIIAVIILIIVMKNKMLKYNIYIENEIIDLSLIRNNKYFIYINNINKLIWLWGILVIFSTLNHLFVPIGLFNSLPYHIGYWLWSCALGLYIIPYIIFGLELINSHINYGLNSQLYINKSIFNNRIYYREFIICSNYQRKYIKLLEDLFCFTSLIKGFFSLLNWFYQILYFGIRLWLVFILHQFCLASFSELFSVFTDQFLFIFPIYGYISLGLPISLLMILYLFIQIYVYISFSITFLFTTILSYYRNELYHFHSYHGPNLFFLIPVSIVDLAPSHIYFYIIIILLFIFISSRSFFASTHYKYYLKIYYKLLIIPISI